MSEESVRARRRRGAALAAWLGPVIDATLAVVLLVDGSILGVLVAVLGLVLLPFLIGEATEQVELRSDSIMVKRPPLPRRGITAGDIEKIERFTPSQWFVRSRRRRRPLTITFRWLQNEAEVKAALVDLATRHAVPIVETNMYRDTS
jgi:hypothetical protein